MSDEEYCSRLNLLVTAAIVAILAAILYPVFAKAREVSIIGPFAEDLQTQKMLPTGLVDEAPLGVFTVTVQSYRDPYGDTASGFLVTIQRDGVVYGCAFTGGSQQESAERVIAKTVMRALSSIYAIYRGQKRLDQLRTDLGLSPRKDE